MTMQTINKDQPLALPFCASGYFERMEPREIARKIRANEGHNEDRRRSARRTWENWYLPAVQEVHLLRGLRPGDEYWRGLKCEDEEHVAYLQSEALRMVHAHLGSIFRQCNIMLRVNAAWIADARLQLALKGGAL